MQDSANGRLVPLGVLERRLLRLDENLAGLTLSGGEPFDQAEPLGELLGTVRAARPHWSVIVYTGFVLGTLRRRSAAEALLACTDVLIAGPYRGNVPQSHALAGSGNQTVHLLSARGQAMKEQLNACRPQSVNFGLGPGSFNMIIGVMKDASRDAMRDVLLSGCDSTNESARCDT